jgi:nitrite reductase/ring-hydroxylating ferredoxin subunit
MPEPEEKRAERIDRVINDLLRGRRLGISPADAGEKEAIMAAATLVAAKESYPHMSPRFRRRLSRRLAQEEAISWVTRRAALVGGVGLVAGTLAGVAGSKIAGLHGQQQPPYTPLPEPVGRATIEPRPELARWVDTGLTLRDLKEGIPRRANAGSIGVFVVNYEGQLMALSAFCTHLPCELHWQAAGSLLCPCHNRAFSLEGVSLDPYYPLPPLPLARVRVRDGRIEVYGT